jgi:hypothetical protein
MKYPMELLLCHSISCYYRFKYINPKNCFQDPDLDFLPIPNPRSQIPDAGVEKAPDPGSWILDQFHTTFILYKDNEERVQSPAGSALPGRPPRVADQPLPLSQGIIKGTVF